MAANSPKTPKNFEELAKKAPTQLHEDFAHWLYIQTGIKADLKTVQLAVSFRMDFQASPENQKSLAERKAKAAELKKASAERKKAKLEKMLAEIKGEVKTEEPAEVAPVEDEKVEAPAEPMEPVRLTIVYGGYEPEVHKAGCAYIKKARRRGKSQETSKFSSHTELTHHIYSDMIDSGESTLEENYMAYDAKPCC